MEALKQRILAEGKHLGNGILKVDSFLNHQVDPALMMTCGQELARRFRPVAPNKVLTAEISGIAPAFATAYHLGVPLVFARKHKPITMPEEVYLTYTPSPTKGRIVELMLSPEYVGPGDRILIVDDFLASGATILGLARLARTAGAQVVGVGALIEKVFERGRERLQAELGVPIEALARIARFEGDRIIFVD
ncbi:MAG: xanthine phosphoribosyltransferase [Chloroflexi bacterium]|nr:xanthine phosphoribosyltransferase [Chloroflexota bacterium]